MRVYDISKLSGENLKTERPFFVDTNVMLYLHYSKITLYNEDERNKAAPYTDFINALIESDRTVITSIYNIMELVYLIEEKEFDFYKEVNGCDISKKDYRCKIGERKLVKGEIEVATEQIRFLYKDIVYFPIPFNDISDYIEKFNHHKCDNYDYVIAKWLVKEDIRNIITHDRDFMSIPGLNIYTANQRMIAYQ